MIRKVAPTNPRWGGDPNKRPMNELLNFGVVIVDKPPGPSSHQVSAYTKEILHIKKAGHSGTLDPKVTGVLPVCLGSGTRLAQSTLIAGKEYITLMHLHRLVEEYEIRKLLAAFIGKIKQLPPIKSAVKRQVRERNIYYLELLDIKGQDVLFKAGTQAGTYIRKLCHDMGVMVKDKDGSVGAHMVELRRSKAGPFTEEQSCTLHDLKDAYHYYEKGDESRLRKLVLPGEQALSHLKKIWVFDQAVHTLCNGVQLKVPGISKLDDDIKKDDPVAVFTLKNEAILVGTARLSSKQMMGESGVAVKTAQVFMPSGIYPKE